MLCGDHQGGEVSVPDGVGGHVAEWHAEAGIALYRGDRGAELCADRADFGGFKAGEQKL